VTKREFLAGWYTEFLDFTDDIEAQELVEALAERLPALIRTAQEAQRAADSMKLREAAEVMRSHSDDIARAEARLISACADTVRLNGLAGLE
jgi:hypothetical protein